MARALPPLSYRKVAKGLAKAGFSPVRQVGSHERWKHPDGRSATVPRHPGRDIDPWLLHKILKEASLSPEEFLDLI